MYLCYIDESGTPEIPGNTSHFVLAGVSIPIWNWKMCENIINRIKHNYNLENAEIHTGWILREYEEQNKIIDFEKFPQYQRRLQTEQYRNNELLRLQRVKNPKLYHQTKKNYKQTQPYIHLTFNERKNFIKDIAHKIGNLSFIRLFAECIDKPFFSSHTVHHTINEQAFEQIVSRFEAYLTILNKCQLDDKQIYGLIIHDNNPTVAKKHTQLMKQFHSSGTLWTREIKNIIETPLFVDSELTSMIQLADLCGYALRQYLEKNEVDLFEEIYKRADRKDNIVVGVRHFTKDDCTCEICKTHKIVNKTLFDKHPL